MNIQTPYLRLPACIGVLVLALAGCASNTVTTANLDAVPPFTIEYFARPGPLAGVVARIDLTNPHVQVMLALADDRDPDGSGPCVGQLDTTSSAAHKHDFAVTLNASFFAAPPQRKVADKSIHYFVGNCAIPVGWHVANHRQLTSPTVAYLRAVLVVHDDGKVSFHDGITSLPAGTRYAVSGSAIVLRAGEVIASPRNAMDTVRHPRSAVGISADERTLLLVAVDGRQAHSRGATLEELGQLMQSLGAREALNLDGGGSTTLVIKDPATGVYAVANQPSDTAISMPSVHIERPIADVIGIRIR